MGTNYSITDKFGGDLAELLTEKIVLVYPDFQGKKFVKEVEQKVVEQTYTQRVGTIAELLKKYLPSDYQTALQVLVAILGDENPNETGMFTLVITHISHRIDIPSTMSLSRRMPRQIT